MLRTLIIAVVAVAAMAAHAQTRVVAHRGFWKAANGAQNSIEALIKADSLGVYATELDVWMTADGALVVNHDRVFQGVNMETSTLDQVRQIRLANGEVLPTLDEYLAVAQTLPNTRLVLELKSLKDLRREDEAAAKVVDALERHGLMDRTDIIAFSINACLAFKKLCPEGMKILYLDGDLTPKKLHTLGLGGLDYNGRTVDNHPEWIEQARELGIATNVWTIDRPEEMTRYIDMGVDYITTNNPDVLKALVEK